MDSGSNDIDEADSFDGHQDYMVLSVIEERDIDYASSKAGSSQLNRLSNKTPSSRKDSN